MRPLLLTLLATAFVASPLVARAQTAPAPASTLPPSFTANGTFQIRGAYQGIDLNLGAQLALAKRAALIRADLTNISLPGTSAAVSGLVGQLLAPGGYGVIYDGTAHTTTVWSNTSRTYAVQTPAPRASAAPHPSATAPPSTSPTDPLSMTGNFARMLENIGVGSLTLQLTGRTTMNGHPTNGIRLTAQRQASGTTQSVTANGQFADDLGGFPVQFTAQIRQAGSTAFTGDVAMNLTTFTPSEPAASLFQVPAGYTRVNNIGDVVKPPGR